MAHRSTTSLHASVWRGRPWTSSSSAPATVCSSIACTATWWVQHPGEYAALCHWNRTQPGQTLQSPFCPECPQFLGFIPRTLFSGLPSRERMMVRLASAISPMSLVATLPVFSTPATIRPCALRKFSNITSTCNTNSRTAGCSMWVRRSSRNPPVRLEPRSKSRLPHRLRSGFST